MFRMIGLTLVLLAPICASAMDAFVCEPEWGSLLTELAGDQANITLATTAFQDPHSLQARPSLIAAVRRADLIVCTGADLEIGWLPLLLRRANNPKIHDQYQPILSFWETSTHFPMKAQPPMVKSPSRCQPMQTYVQLIYMAGMALLGTLWPMR